MQKIFSLIIFAIIILLSISINSSQLEAKNKQINKLQPIVGEKVFYPFISPDETFVICLTDMGRFFTRIDLQTKKKKRIFSHEILSPEYIYYSPSGNCAVVDSSYPNYHIELYNFLNHTFHNINNCFYEIQWSKKKNKIYSSFRFNKNSEEYWVNISDPDGGNRQIIIKEKSRTFLVSPDEQYLIFFDDNCGINPPKGCLYNIKTKEIKNFSDQVELVRVYWSPDSQKIVYTDRKNHLFVMDKNGQNIQNTPIILDNFMNVQSSYSSESDEDIIMEHLLWKDKNNLVLAVANDFRYSSLITPTNLYVYNIPSKKLTKLNLGNQFFIGVDLISVQNNKTLYFTSDSYLYKIELP